MRPPSGIDLRAYYRPAACKSAGFGDVIKFCITDQRANKRGGVNELVAGLGSAVGSCHLSPRGRTVEVSD